MDRRSPTKPVLVRGVGIAGILAGTALVTGQLLFWFAVPDSGAERDEQGPLVLATGIIWLIAHGLLAPFVGGVYALIFRRVGVFGGSGAVLAVLGTIGLCMYAFFLFPELVGFRPDTVREGRIALSLQATGELGVASLLVGLFLLAFTMLMTRVFAPVAASLIVVGAVVAPFGLDNPVWLVLGSCLIGAGSVWMGLLLVAGRFPMTGRSRPIWPRPGRQRQYRF